MSHRRNRALYKGMTPLAFINVRNIFNQRQRQCWWKKKGEKKDKEIKMRTKSPTWDKNPTSHPHPAINLHPTVSTPTVRLLSMPGLYLSEHYQALWGTERAWNGPLIEHGYYSLLLFLNPEHNDLQMLWEEEVMGNTRVLSVFKTDKNNPTNPRAKVFLAWHGMSRSEKYWGSNSIRYYSTQS